MAATAVRAKTDVSSGDEALAAMNAAEVLLENPKQAPVIIGASKYHYTFKSRAGEILANKGYDYYFDAYDPKWDEPDDTPEMRRWAKLAKANWKQRNPDPAWQKTLARAL